MSSEPVTAEGTAQARKGRGSTKRTLLILVVAVLVIDVLAVIFVPPFAKDDPSTLCGIDPVCLIDGTLHFPRPHEIWIAGGEEPVTSMVAIQVSLTDSLLTMFLVTAVVLIAAIAVSRGRAPVPGFFQNFVEWAYESFTKFARGMGGARANPYIPIFAGFFILILAFNWSGLIPPVGLIKGLRAPTSDINVTLGLALVAFGYFEVQGFRRLGVGGYLGKFFPIHEFRNGVGAGLIAMFVGFVELILEFIKPITLSVRLFGNIYGGEVALAVVTSLFIALIPIAMYGLEIILTFVQALIFSTLTLVFTLIAVESHSHEEGHPEPEDTEYSIDVRGQVPATGH